MASKNSSNMKAAVLPWGMSEEKLQPNSVKGISKSKIKAFNVGRMNPLKKQSSFVKKKEEKEHKKKMEAKQTAEVFEEFVASFEESDSSGKAFVRGSTSIKPAAIGDEAIPNPIGGAVYKPRSKLLQRIEDKQRRSEDMLFSPPAPAPKKPIKKKGAEKKKSILELFKEELKRSQDMRKERKMIREGGRQEEAVVQPKPVEEPFLVEEYKDMAAKGSFDSGDPLTTNLYVGNINPKMNEENLCQLFGKFGPLASVKVMWPRTEEEKARKKNCGFVAYMKREDAEESLDHFKGTSIMEYEIQIGWGKAVRVPPQPVYVAPDEKEDEQAKTLDPPSGMPFNAQTKNQPKSKSGGGYGSVPPPSSGSGGVEDMEEGEDKQTFEDMLYNAIVRVVIPTDIELLRLIHRMIEFVIREGPMFEAMIMNRELTNPKFQFLFDNRSPAHVYYRWKLFSILQGDSPETWRVDEFRMFEGGSVWKPPPLKNLRSKLMPPLEDDVIIRRGQLSTRQRDELEDQLRNLSMERDKIKKSMVWCLDHADSADEIVECMCEALGIAETPLPIKIARLYLVSDILQNCSSAVPHSSNFRRGFEGKLMSIIEHFHSVMLSISSRIRAEQFKRRVLSCLRAWDQMSVYHYNVVDKLRLTFIGKTTEEMEKQKAFETVAALIGVGEEAEGVGGNDEVEAHVQREHLRTADDLDGVPIFDDRPIDFSGGAGLDGMPMESLDGVSFQEASIDGEPIGSQGGDIDGMPLEAAGSSDSAVTQPTVVKSKWELVDYDSDDSESEVEEKPAKGPAAEVDERQQLMAEVDERKRKILREVEVKAMELYDALESSGSYSKTEITQRVDKYRDKLMQEAVEPKFSPPPSKMKSKAKSRSPSPSVLDKYRLDESPQASSRRRKSRSASPCHERKQSLSPISPARSTSPPPLSRKRSWSPLVHRRSSSRSRRHSRSRSRSPRKKRSRSPVKRRSRSPVKRRSRSPLPVRKRSRSPPVKRRSKSRSRSRSPHKSSTRKKSKSPRRRRKSRSRSPAGKNSKKSKKRSRSRSRSPHKSKSKKSKH